MYGFFCLFRILVHENIVRFFIYVFFFNNSEEADKETLSLYVVHECDTSGVYVSES